MADIRSPRVRGPYHDYLVELLRAQLAKKEGITQESLATAIRAGDQTTVGKKLSGKGGPFDLDEADAALRHVGSSLKDFVTDPTRVPVIPQAEQMPPLVAKILKKLRALAHDEKALLIVLAAADLAETHVRRRASKKSSSRRVGARTRADGPDVAASRRRRR